MNKVNELLSLTADASESSTVEAIQQLQNSVSELGTANESLLAQVEQMQNELSEVHKAKAVSLIENAVSEGKISESAKAVWTSKAIENIDNTVELLNSIKGAKAPIVVENKAKGSSVETVENANWTFEQWSKNDPKGLDAMRVENKTKYDKLFNAYCA